MVQAQRSETRSLGRTKSLSSDEKAETFGSRGMAGAGLRRQNTSDLLDRKKSENREQVDKLLQADLDDDEAHDTDGMVSGGEQEEDLLAEYEPFFPGDPDVEMPLLGDDGLGLDRGTGEEIAAPRRRLKRKTRPDELEGPDEEQHSLLVCTLPCTSSEISHNEARKRDKRKS